MKKKHMKQLLLFFFFLSAPASFFAQMASTIQYQQEAKQLLSDAIAHKACMGIAAGFAIADEVKWTGGNGFSDEDQRKPFLPSTLNRIASITKPMTAIAIMQLYEQHKLDLDATIQTYLPNFPASSRGNITVRHLLSHASGIGAYQSGKERENKKNYASLEQALDIFKDRELLARPGERFNYSTYGYVVLGCIIEKVSGMSYEAFLRENIWKKAGMEHTGVDYFGQHHEHKTQLYHKNKKGKIKCVKPTNLSDRVPGGGLYSTVDDLLKFGNAILNGSLLKKETLELMITDTGLKKEGNPYGLGWYLYGDNPTHGFIFGHTGGQTGTSAMFLLLPAQQTTIIVLSNTSGAMQTVSDIAVQLFDVAAKSKR